MKKLYKVRYYLNSECKTMLVYAFSAPEARVVVKKKTGALISLMIVTEVKPVEVK